MYHFNDLTGRRFGLLSVIKKSGNAKDRHLMWECQCDCGNTKVVSSRDLVSGHTKSCGCYQKYCTSLSRRIHGGVGDRTHVERLYKIWVSMRQRCFNKNNHAYKYYGGRGISVCDLWNDYENFRTWAIANGYDSSADFGECTIDRINNDGNYEPSNCRWVSMSVQNKNKRKSC